MFFENQARMRVIEPLGNYWPKTSPLWFEGRPLGEIWGQMKTVVLCNALISGISSCFAVGKKQPC